MSKDKGERKRERGREGEREREKRERERERERAHELLIMQEQVGSLTAGALQNCWDLAFLTVP